MQQSSITKKSNTFEEYSRCCENKVSVSCKIFDRLDDKIDFDLRFTKPELSPHLT